MRFNSFTSENFLGMSSSSNPDVSFANSVHKKQLNILMFITTVELNSSKKDDLSILHSNITILNKRFKNIISRTWLLNSNYLPR